MKLRQKPLQVFIVLQRYPEGTGITDLRLAEQNSYVSDMYYHGTNVFWRLVK
jgi:hypothetical protein